MIISDATVDEADEVSSLLVACWAATYGSVLSADDLERIAREWHSPDLLGRQIANPRIIFRLARTASGLLAGTVTARASEDQQSVSVLRLYVVPKFQRRGVGTRLLNGALEAFPNARRVELQVAAVNPDGVGFWRERGFAECGRSLTRVGTLELALITMERLIERPER